VQLRSLTNKQQQRRLSQSGFYAIAEQVAAQQIAQAVSQGSEN
jgi:hypothetical protein